MARLLPIVLMLLGLGAGVGAGIALRPEPPPDPCAADTPSGAAHKDCPAPDDPGPAPPSGTTASALAPDLSNQAVEYAPFDRQFVVPVVYDARVDSLVVVSMTIVTATGRATDVYAHEPRLRDAFLQVLFRHANSGGFAGSFTDAQPMGDLRSALRIAAREVIGDLAMDVLVTEIVRQDVQR